MYYGRPVYYAPAPFLPIPPLWGYVWLGVVVTRFHVMM
jgi:hypothetical protein